MTTPSTNGATARPLRVLLVDDHEDTNRMLTLLLKRRGYEVQAATSITGAVRAFEENTWDVLVCDMNLPDGSGADLLALLPSRPELGGIIVSGLSSEEDAERTLAAGYQAHLGKPVDLGKLDMLIRQMAADAGR